MSDQQKFGRVQLKHDIQANWEKATNFTPLAGEIIIYVPDENYPYSRFKIGDGYTVISNLPFATSEEIALDKTLSIEGAAADAKAVGEAIPEIYTQDTEPTEFSEGAIWIDTSDENPTMKIRKNDQWVDLSTTGGAVKYLPQDLTSAQASQARNNIGVFTQPTQPAAANEGDIWFDTSKNFMDTVYPVGSIYMSVNPTSPAALFGGSWEAIQGRFLIGKDNEQFITAGAMGGEAQTTLPVNQMPAHKGHLYGNGDAVWSTTSEDTYYMASGLLSKYGKDRPYIVRAGNEAVPRGFTRGGDQPHNNLPPYLVVYMWKRTA